MTSCFGADLTGGPEQRAERWIAKHSLSRRCENTIRDTDSCRAQDPQARAQSHTHWLCEERILEIRAGGVLPDCRALESSSSTLERAPQNPSGLEELDFACGMWQPHDAVEAAHNRFDGAGEERINRGAHASRIDATTTEA